MQKRKQINELYLTRTLAILGVIMVHSTSLTTVVLERTSSLYPIYNFLNIFCKFGTQTFIFLSSFVLFYSYFNRPFNAESIKRFYKRRMLYIIVPYILFSAFYFGYRWHVNGWSFSSEVVLKFLKDLALGDAYTHLYFVFINIQFYILFPFLLLFFKKFPNIVKLAFWIGLALQWTFVLLNKYYIGITEKGSLAISYMALYMLGVFAGIHFETFLAWLQGKVKYVLAAAWVANGLGYVYCFYNMRVHGTQYNSLLIEFFSSTHGILSALMLFLLSFWVYQRFSPRIVNAMIQIGVCSFGIYLIHPFINIIYRNYPVGGHLTYHLWVAGNYLAALLVSWAIVHFTFKYVKGAWVLFGSRPKQTPYVEEKTNKLPAGTSLPG